jgi:hypothetical protein
MLFVLSSHPGNLSFINELDVAQDYKDIEWIREPTVSTSTK